MALPTSELRLMQPPLGVKTSDLSPKELLATLLYRNRIRDSLEEWAHQALADQGMLPARHHKLILSRLEAIERGEIKRLMIFAPPGSAKSTYGSVLFPAWYFARHPSNAIIACSNTQSLAESFGRKVRNSLDEFAATLGVALAEDSQAAGRWNTNKEGTYLAAGVGGKIAGRRADLAIIDDPIGSVKEAYNPTIRDSIHEWYKQDLYTRLKPGAAIVLINTRWHEDDLSGRLEADSLSGTGGKWEVLRLPAIPYEDGTPDPFNRAAGEALWPEWENEEALAEKRRDVGERTWAALFQQRPRPDSGALFDTTKFTFISESELEQGIKWISAYDLAATDQVGTRNPDWTVRVRMGRMKNGMTVVGNVRRIQGRPDQVDKFLLENAKSDGKKVKIGIPQDPGQAGKSQIAYFVRLLAGYLVVASPESGDKSTRAAPFASQVTNGQVVLVRGDWNKAYTEELSGFPAAAKDDQVDASSRAFSMLLAPMGRRSRVISAPGLLSR